MDHVEINDVNVAPLIQTSAEEEAIEKNTQQNYSVAKNRILYPASIEFTY
jgi:hypothetical protein